MMYALMHGADAHNSSWQAHHHLHADLDLSGDHESAPIPLRPPSHKAPETEAWRLCTADTVGSRASPSSSPPGRRYTRPQSAGAGGGLGASSALRPTSPR